MQSTEMYVALPFRYYEGKRTPKVINTYYYRFITRGRYCGLGNASSCVARAANCSGTTTTNYTNSINNSNSVQVIWASSANQEYDVIVARVDSDSDTTSVNQSYTVVIAGTFLFAHSLSSAWRSSPLSPCISPFYPC